MDAQKLIDGLGGATIIARKLGIPMTTVHGWKRRNAIPAWRMKDMAKLAKRAGVEV